MSDFEHPDAVIAINPSRINRTASPRRSDLSLWKTAQEADNVAPLRENIRYGPTRPRPSCSDALLSALSNLDSVTPSNRMPLVGGNTVRTRPMLTLRKLS